MPYLIVHLAIAQRVIDRFPAIKNKGAFYLGSLAPDTSGFAGLDKSASHFCVGDEGWGFYTNYGEWMDNTLRKINEYRGQVDEDFLLGYLAHMVADIEYAEQVWTPIRLQNDEALIKEHFADCGEIDSLLLSKLQNINEIWAALQSSNHHYLPGLFTCEDVAVLIDKTVNHMYKDRQPNVGYIFTVHNLKKFEAFIESTANKILRIIS